MNLNERIQIYSSNFNENKVCIPHMKYNPNPTCQKSQRMFLTAYNLHKSFESNDIMSNINAKFCIGEYNALMNEIEDSTNKQIVIIWEHNEIIDIIRFLGIKIDKWKNKFDDIYDIIFMIDENNDLYYDCYDFENNVTGCNHYSNNQDFQKWLSDFPMISKKDPIYQSVNMVKYKSGNNSLVIICILSSLFLGCIIIFARKVCIKTKKSLFRETVKYGSINI